MFTNKEKMFLQELKSEEKLCVDKYSKYAANACDGNLKNIFTELANVEQGHLNTINDLINGKSVNMSSSNAARTEVMPMESMCSAEQKQSDAYLCRDALSAEKHVSSVYNTSIFEFTDDNIRNTLNHIQKEEQEHGKKIYDYMEKNNMY